MSEERTVRREVHQETVEPATTTGAGRETVTHTTESHQLAQETVVAKPTSTNVNVQPNTTVTDEDGTTVSTGGVSVTTPDGTQVNVNG